MKKIIFLLLVSISSVENVQAATREVISACKQGAKNYSKYALSLDEYFQKVVGKNPYVTSQLTDVDRYIRQKHEEYKEQEATLYYKASEVLLQKREKLPEEIEFWRVTQMLTLELAYTFARDNLFEGKIGRTQEYYEIKIYDECIR